MKRTLAILFCIIVSHLSFAQQKYEIYNIQGDVQIKRANETSWSKATVFTAVAPQDLIGLKKGSSICILETGSNRLFTSSEAGSLSLKRRLDKAHKNEQTLFSALNSELKKAIRKNKDDYKPLPSYSASANGVRAIGRRNKNSVYDSVYVCILHYIQNTAFTAENDINAEKHLNVDSTFYLTIQNNTGKTLFCNLLHIKDGTVSLCFHFDNNGFIPLPTGHSADLSAFTFIPDQGQYILIASEKSLSAESLQEAIDSNKELPPLELPFITLIRL